MIHVATAHFGYARWVDIQLDYLRRNLREPFKVWASLQNVPGDHNSKFHRTVPASGPHAGKLNLIAGEISAEARPDDVIIFLDGDAFPIADPVPAIRSALETTSLLAVRRDENAADRQPHPCFCAVTVREWARLAGDWSPGFSWEGSDGTPTTDVGGNLLRALERNGASWTPLLRTNRVNLHPLWFAVYGDIAYHHGAGFRWAIGRVDLANRQIAHVPGKRLPVVGAVARRLELSRQQRYQTRTAARVEHLREDMLAKIEKDPEFYRELV